MLRDHTVTVHCTTALVMGLQFRYQRAKLYREVAMGEKHHMTVSQGEGGKGSPCAILYDNLNHLSAFRGKAFQSTVSTGLPPWDICMSLYGFSTYKLVCNQ